MTLVSSIRSLSPSEVEELIDWARIEGWNPGLADASPFYTADTEGFIGCFADGRMAAGISAVRYGANFGFIGLYIAHPDFRGKGLGRKVWDAGMRHLSGRIIGLDGVPAQQENYRSMGFQPLYKTVRWSGTFRGASSPEVAALSPNLIPEIIAYDRQFFPAERGGFLDKWLTSPRFSAAIRRSGEIRGYAVCRECHDGIKIGPLFAETRREAEELLAACATYAGSRTIHIDVPAAQADFAETLSNAGFSRGFVTARMYHGPAPSLRMEGIFGISTLELG